MAKRGRKPYSETQPVELDIKKAKLLKCLEMRGLLKTACKAAGITYRTYYNWRESDAEFAKAADDAREMAGEMLEIEAHRRAVVGVKRSIYHQGNVVGHEREYSDSLLVKMLAANLPEKYGRPTASNTFNTQINIGASDATPVAEVSPERRAMLRRLRMTILGAFPEAQAAADEARAAGEQGHGKSLPMIDQDDASNGNGKH